LTFPPNADPAGMLVSGWIKKEEKGHESEALYNRADRE
jgi:hypothetical protein